MIKFQHVFITLMCILLKSIALAQFPAFENYSIEDGLQSSECYQVIQDKEGFIWVASDKGVARYDGNTFRIFTISDGLPDNCILRMHEDDNGRIWVAGFSGNIAYFQHGKFVPLAVNEELSRLIQPNIVNSLTFYKDTLWIGMTISSENYRVIFKNGKERIEKHSIGRKGSGYIKKLENGRTFQGVLYSNDDKIIESFELDFFDEKNERTVLVDLRKEDSSMSISNLRITKRTNGNYLCAYFNRLFEFNPASGKVLKRRTFDEKILFVSSDVNGGIWMGVRGNGVKYFPNEIEQEPRSFLNFNSISGICEDNEGGHWFTSLNSGLFYLASSEINYAQTNDAQNITCLSSVGDTILAGTDDGKILLFKNGLIGEIDLQDHQLVLSEIDATEKGYLFVLINNGKSRKIKLTSPYPIQTSLNIAGRHTCWEPKSEKRWIINLKLIICLNSKNKRIGPSSFSDFPYRMNDILTDDHGNIWLVGDNGLYLFKDKKFISYAEKDARFGRKIKSFSQKKDAFWFSMKERGVMIYRKGKVYELNQEGGLSSNICSSLFLESDSKGWVVTNRGLCMIRIKSWSPFKYAVRQITAKDGLVADEITDVHVLNGFVYVSGKNGLTWFKESSIRKNPVSPPIYIKNLLMNEAVQTEGQSFDFKHFENNIAIDFIGLCYKSRGDVTYMYRLVGLDTTWKETPLTKLNFLSLPAGDYRFEVKAVNNSGLESETPATIAFSIGLPFWKTWPFILLVLLLIISGIVLYLRVRIKLITKRAAEKEDLYRKASEMEMRFLSSQMNPHFTFNVMNSIQSYMLDNEPRQAQKYLAKYAKLIRRVLDTNMKKYSSIQEEMDLLEMYLDMENMRFEIKFSFEIKAHFYHCQEYLIPPMIIMTYVENAIWHGILKKKEPGEIEVSFDQLDELIRCTVQDNGVGRNAKDEPPHGEEHNSLGMYITQQRLKQTQSTSKEVIPPRISDLMDANNRPIGTKVEIYFPIIKDTSL